MKKIENKKFKVIITILSLIAFQSLLYLLAKFTPFEYHIVNIAFDNKIPFIKYFVYPYIIWYITLFLVPYLYSKYDIKLYNIYLKTLFIAITIVFVTYIFYPTTLIRDPVITTDLSTFIINLIYKLDTPAINCLPSMHCLISFLHIFITPKVKKIKTILKVIIIVQSILVILSTVFIKQHVILDVIFAFVLSLLIYIPTYLFYVKKNLSSARS